MPNDQIYNAALSAQKAGRHPEAITLYQQVLKSSPTHGPSLQGLASSQFSQGRWGEAAQTLNTLSELMPTSPAIWQALSQASARHRSYPKAIAAFEAFLELSPKNPGNYLAFADLLLMAHDEDRALATLAIAQELGSDNADTHYLAARLMILKGNTGSAFASLSTALEREPHHPSSWALLVNIAEMEDIPALLPSLQLALNKAQTEHGKLLLSYALGKAYEKQEDYDLAFSAFKNANDLQTVRLKKNGQAYKNEAIEADFDDLMKWYSNPSAKTNAQPSERSPIFILGLPRTGTTLVERILGRLHGVYTGGENEAMEFIANQYHFEVRQGRAPSPSQAPDMLWNALSEDYWKRTLAPTPLVTDKMPHNFRHIGMIIKMFPTAPIIFMQRDPRDVALSIFTRFFPDGHNYACDLEVLAHYYKQHDLLMAHWQSIAPDQILAVNYKDLVTMPEEMSKKIASHCHLDWTIDCLDFHRDTHASYTFSELQVRQPVNTKGLERWRVYEKHLAPFVKAFES